MFDLGKTSINIDCPECGFKNSVRLEDVAKETVIICNGCLKSIQLIDKDSSTRKGIRNVDNALNELNNTLKRLF